MRLVATPLARLQLLSLISLRVLILAALEEQFPVDLVVALRIAAFVQRPDSVWPDLLPALQQLLAALL